MADTVSDKPTVDLTRELSVAEAATIARMTAPHIYAAIRSEVLPKANKDNEPIRVRYDELLHWIENRRRPGRPNTEGNHAEK